MNKQSQSDTKHITDRPDHALNGPADLTNQAIRAARTRLNNAMESGKELIADLRETTSDRVKAADQGLRDHPYQALAIAVGVGTVLGLFLAQGWPRRRERERLGKGM